MKSLITVVPGQEFDEEFLDQVRRDSSEVFILAVFDTDLLNHSAGQEIGSMALMEEVADEMNSYLNSKNVKSDYSVEWGSLSETVSKRAKQRGVKSIYLQRINAPFFKDLMGRVKDECKFAKLIVL